jgi:hypothetical protein
LALIQGISLCAATSCHERKSKIAMGSTKLKYPAMPDFCRICVTSSARLAPEQSSCVAFIAISFS